MPEDAKIIPFNEIPDSGIDLNLAVEQAQKMTALLDAMDIEKATFRSGVVFHHDETNNTTTLATDGLIVQQRQHSTSVTFRHEGSTERKAIEELAKGTKVTQEVLGAFSGKSQPWASRALSHDESDE